jgi:hypothetical protein
MKPLASFLLLPTLALGLVACGDVPVEVASDAPYPASQVDVPGIARRWQGRYLAAGDTSQALLLQARLLVRQQWHSWTFSRHALDSLGVPQQPGANYWRGQRYRVQELAPDSLQLSWQEQDTLWQAGTQQPARLRYYQGSYYLSVPNPSQPDRWQVQRLVAAGLRLSWQELLPDSLRFRALDAGAVALQRTPSHVQFTLHLPGRRVQRQLSQYAGLWQPLGQYQRQ